MKSSHSVYGVMIIARLKSRTVNRDPKGKPPELSDFMPFYKEKKEEEFDDGSADYLANR